MCEILLHVSRNLYQHDLKKTTIYNSLYRYVFYDNFSLLSDLFIYVLLFTKVSHHCECVAFGE